MGLFLDFVQNDQAPEVSQCTDRVLQASQVLAVLKVEERALDVTRQFPSERGFAALPGPEECGDGMVVDTSLNTLEKRSSSDVHS